MGAQGLASFASGVTQSLFGGLLKDRQDEQDKKDEELKLQLAAYHALLEHPDTPESSIPDIMDAQANLLKIGPQFKPVTDHMRAGMKQQVPYGPPQETTGSKVTTTASGVDAANEQNRSTPLATSINLRPTTVPGETAQASPVSYSPYSPQTENLAPPAVPPTTLRVVPPEPVMGQPTKAYGDLTHGEAVDLRKGQIYQTQQEAQMRRQLTLANEADDARAERQAQKALEDKRRDDARQQGRLDLENKKYENKRNLLAPAAQAKVEGNRLAYENSLMLQGMNPDEAKVASAKFAQNQADTLLAVKQSEAAKNKASIKHWERQDANQLLAINKRGEGVGGATAGLSASEARYLRAQTIEVIPDVNSARSELNKLYTLRASINGTVQPGQPGYDASYDAEIARQEQRRDEGLEKIRATRQEILDSRKTAPAQGGSAPTQRSGQTYNVPLQKYGLNP